MRHQILTFAVALSAIVGCTFSERNFVEENIADAGTQLNLLMEACEEGDTVRVPVTFQNGEVTFVPKNDWTSGFFAGSLWYMYELTGDERWAVHAQKHTENLYELQWLTWHHDVGFMVYNSFGNGRRLKEMEAYDTVLVNTAKSLSTRFRPAAGVIQSWNADRGWQAQRGWTCPVIIDNMMNLELLFKASEISGDSTFRNIAISHADKTLENHFREDFSTWHVVDYDPVSGKVLSKCTAQGAADESAWARGQAWALYGFVVAYRFTGDERYLKRAQEVENFIFSDENMPEDLVPYWDFDAPGIPDEPRDASSASIIASALYELYWHTGVNDYKKEADQILRSLSSPAYHAETGTNGGFLLMHSVGSIPHGSQIDVPLNYADYYFLEALSRKVKLGKGMSPVAF